MLGSLFGGRARRRLCAMLLFMVHKLCVQWVPFFCTAAGKASTSSIESAAGGCPVRFPSIRAGASRAHGLF